MDLYLKEGNFSWPSAEEFYNGLCCPITKQIFDTPVTIGGKTYEKSALLKWFKSCGSHRDPLTGKELSGKLCPDYTTIYFRDLFLKNNPGVIKYEPSQEDKELVKEYDNRIVANNNDSIKPTIVFQFVLPGSELAQLSLPVN